MVRSSQSQGFGCLDGGLQGIAIQLCLWTPAGGEMAPAAEPLPSPGFVSASGTFGEGPLLTSEGLHCLGSD